MFSTGIDPGFFSDYLPVVLSGCSRQIDSVQIYEMAIYTPGSQSDSVAFDQVGFGSPITASRRWCTRTDYGPDGAGSSP